MIWRFELLPIKGITDQALLLPEATTIAITCSQNLGLGSTLRASKRLAQLGFQVVPHIAARLVPDNNDTNLKSILEDLRDNEVDEIFVCGGDAKEPLGKYSSSLELLSAISKAGHSLKEIGIAAYPDGHPFLNDKALVETLRAKQFFAAYMVTQICFDPKRIIGWIKNMRAEGITLPVYIGILGVLPKTKVLSIGIRTGVLPNPKIHPWKFLKKIAQFWRAIIDPSGFHPDKIVRELAQCLDNEKYNIRGFHIYTFNQVEPTEKWRKEFLSK